MGVPSIYRAAVTAGFAAIVAAGATRVANAQIVVKGTLYDDATGGPVRASVMLVDPATNGPVAKVISDSAGAFELRSAQGTYQIAAVRDGYTSVLSVPIPLANGEHLTLRVPIAREGDPKHQIGVLEHTGGIDMRAPRQQADASVGGYESRRAAGLGLHYSHDRMAASGRETLGEFLQGLPGLNVTSPTAASTISSMRSLAMSSATTPLDAACHMGWFVDGHRLDLPGQPADATVDALLEMRTDNIDELEVFRGLSEMPSEFAAPDLHCGAIAIWTRK